MESVLVITLLDKAKEITSSDYKTAKAIGVSSQVISDWRHQRRPTPPEDIALLAAVAGLNPETWLVRGTLEKHAGTKKGERLATVLGKALAATGGVIGSSTATAKAFYGIEAAQRIMDLCSTMYRLVKIHATCNKGPKGPFFSSALRKCSVGPALAALAAPVVRFAPLMARPLRSSDERQG